MNQTSVPITKEAIQTESGGLPVRPVKDRKRRDYKETLCHTLWTR